MTFSLQWSVYLERAAYERSADYAYMLLLGILVMLTFRALEVIASLARWFFLVQLLRAYNPAVVLIMMASITNSARRRDYLCLAIA